MVASIPSPPALAARLCCPADRGRERPRGQKQTCCLPSMPSWSGRARVKLLPRPPARPERAAERPALSRPRLSSRAAPGHGDAASLECANAATKSAARAPLRAGSEATSATVSRMLQRVGHYAIYAGLAQRLLCKGRPAYSAPACRHGSFHRERLGNLYGLVAVPGCALGCCRSSPWPRRISRLHRRQKPAAAVPVRSPPVRVW